MQASILHYAICKSAFIASVALIVSKPELIHSLCNWYEVMLSPYVYAPCLVRNNKQMTVIDITWAPITTSVARVVMCR